MIEVKDLSVHFGGVIALDQLSIKLVDDIVGIIGPNGAGKTTLLNAISGFVPLSSGQIYMGDKLLSDLSPSKRARLGLSRSFQRTQTIEDLSVIENIQVGIDSKYKNSSEITTELEHIIEFFNLQDCLTVECSELDSFRNRLVELARCLIMQPEILLLDEPAGGLGSHETKQLETLLGAIPEKFNTQILLIDHDIDLISALCSYTMVLDFGKLIAQGNTKEVLKDTRVREAYLGKTES